MAPIATSWQTTQVYLCRPKASRYARQCCCDSLSLHLHRSLCVNTCIKANVLTLLSLRYACACDRSSLSQPIKTISLEIARITSSGPNLLWFSKTCLSHCAQTVQPFALALNTCRLPTRFTTTPALVLQQVVACNNVWLTMPL